MTPPPSRTEQTHQPPGRRRALLSLLSAAFFAAPMTAAAQFRRREDRRRRRRFRDPGPGAGAGLGPRQRQRFRRRFQDRSPEYRGRLRAAMAAGEIRPLRQVNAGLRARGAELLDADLYETPQGWVYDLRVLGPRGRIRDVMLDARTLRRLSEPPGEVFEPDPG